MGWMADETGLERTSANYVPLTPLSALTRAARVYAGETAVVYGAHRKTYAEYHDRVTRLASALAAKGVKPGDVVATLIPNLPAQAEAHFGVPACGAVLNTINTRLDTDTVAYILDHAEARVLLVDSQFLALAEKAVAQMQGAKPQVIEVPDAAAGHPASAARGPRGGAQSEGALPQRAARTLSRHRVREHRWCGDPARRPPRRPAAGER